ARRRAAPQAAEHGEAVKHRHPDVEQHDVRLQTLDLRQSLGAVRCLTDDHQAGVTAEDETQAPAHHRVVVDQEDRDLPGHLVRVHRTSPVGRTASRTKSPSTISCRAVPATAAVRSATPTSPYPGCPPGTPVAGTGLLTRIRTSWPVCVTRTVTGSPGACLRAFVSASCTIRYAWRLTYSGTVPAPVIRWSIDWPDSSASATRTGSSSRVGCGASGSASGFRRRVPSTVRRSASDWRASDWICAAVSRAVPESRSVR